MTKAARISYWFILITILLVGWLHLATPLLAVLFSYFVLAKLRFTKSRWLAIWLFVIVIAGIAYGLGHFVNQSVEALPKIVNNAIDSFLKWDWAREQDFQLPFDDYEGLKAMVMDVDTVKEQAKNLGMFATFAKAATAQVVFLIVGAVVAASIFLKSQLDLDRATHAVKNNLYSLACEEIVIRFQVFYQSFSTVMGAQIIISAINTTLTSVFAIAVGLPYAVLVIGVTFLCGLLPVLGNLISNAVIVCISFTVSPQMALASLIFLVVIHKLEYFLNSKIIGDRIRNPIWLTLLGLILGEKLMGIPGMILAPVILNYIKVEAAKVEVAASAHDGAPPRLSA